MQSNNVGLCDHVLYGDCYKDESLFHLIVKLERVSNLSKQCHYQIMYNFLGAKVQTTTFLSSPMVSSPSLPYISKEDMFQISVAQSDLSSFLAENPIMIYLYGDEELHGSAIVSLACVFHGNKNESCSFMTRSEYYAQGWVEFDKHSENQISLLEEELKNDSPKVFLSLSLSNSNAKWNTILRNSNHQQLSLYEPEVMKNYLNSNSDSCFPTTDHLLQKLKEIAKAEIEIDKKQREWTENMHREEQKFRQHVRKKEAVVQQYLVQKLKQEESKHIKILEYCRRDYKHLESRLKTALADIEVKEREMKRIIAANNTTFVQKITELDLKEKLIREEAQHLVDMEKTKIEALRGKMKLIENNAEATKNREINLEKEASQLRKKLNNSNEAKAIHDMNTIKIELEDTRLKLKQEITEKNTLASQKDEYRHAAHKLAKMLRREKEKSKSSTKQRFVGKERDELLQIQQELKSLSFAEEKI